MSDNLGKMNHKSSVRTVVIVMAIFLALWGFDRMTGLLTTFHLRNEAQLAIGHKPGSALYEEMVDELIADSRMSEHWQRKIAAKELGNLGKGAARAAPALQALLNDEDRDIRFEAAIALVKVGDRSPEIAAALTEVLSLGRDYNRLLAVQSLGILGADAAASVPSLAALYAEVKSVDIKEAIIIALKKIGTPEAKESVQRIRATQR